MNLRPLEAKPEVAPLLRVTLERERDCDGGEPCDIDKARGAPVGPNGEIREETHEHDGFFNFTVERVDGLVELTRVRGYDGDRFLFETRELVRGTGPWDPQKAHCEGGHAWWAETEWEAIGEDMVFSPRDGRVTLPDKRVVEVAKIDRIVVVGKMWAQTYNGPDGYDCDSGFDWDLVEEVVVRE